MVLLLLTEAGTKFSEKALCEVMLVDPGTQNSPSAGSQSQPWFEQDVDVVPSRYTSNKDLDKEEADVSIAETDLKKMQVKKELDFHKLDLDKTEPHESQETDAESTEPKCRDQDLHADKNMVQRKEAKAFKIQRYRRLLNFSFLFTIMIFAQAACISSAQNLPQDCLDLLENQHDCPDREFLPDHWEDLNSLCCSKSEGIFQCQIIEEEGKVYNFPACLADKIAAPGKTCELVNNETSNRPPEMSIIYCPPGTYRAHFINCSFVRYPQCERKTKPEPEEETVCDGGRVAEDMFMCRVGFQAKGCARGILYRHDDSCYCEHLTCGKGSRPDRNISSNCSDHSIRVEYFCSNPELVSNSTIISLTRPSYPASGGATPTTVPSGNTDSTPSSHRYIGIILGLVVGAVVFIAVCFVVYRRRESGSSIIISSVSDEKSPEAEQEPMVDHVSTQA